jgi:hyperosmotically inducible periplasmic protein
MTVQCPEEERDVTHVQKSYHYCGGVLLACLILLSGVAMAAERSTGQVVDDALVTTTIKGRFAADPQVSALAINVDTVKGVVTLTGVVESDSARQRAIQLAQETEGVQRVDATNLHVKR